MVDLCHSQLITKSTHKNGMILYLLFTNILELIENVSVLGYKEACSYDHYGIYFKIKLDVPMKKTVKRKVYNYPKADWRALNFDIRIIDWESHIGMHDPHESWPLFRDCVINISLRKPSVMNSKHLGLIQIVKKFFVKKKNGGLKLIRKEEQRKIIRNFVN